MCPVDPVCRQLTASIQSFPYVQSMLYCAVYAHWLRHISHIHQSRYIIYISMVRVMSVVEVCEVLKFGLCGCVSRNSLHVWGDRARSKSATHYRWRLPSVHYVPRCRFPQFSKTWVALLWLGLGLGLALHLRWQLGLGWVLVYTVTVWLGVTVLR